MVLYFPSAPAAPWSCGPPRRGGGARPPRQASPPRPSRPPARVPIRWTAAPSHRRAPFPTATSWCPPGSSEPDRRARASLPRLIAMADDWARPVVHWEIAARDPDRQAAFYRELFSWEIGDGRIMQVPAGLGRPEPGPGGHLPRRATPAPNLYR